MMPEGNQGLMTPQELAARLGVTYSWVLDHSTRKHPRLPAMKLGGLLRFDRTDIEAWIEGLRLVAKRKAS